MDVFNQMKEIKYINFKNGIDFLIKNQTLLFIFTFLEFIPVFIKVIDTSFFFVTYINQNLHLINKLQILSSYYYLHTYISKLSLPKQPPSTFIPIFIITVSYFLPHIFFYINPSFGSPFFKRILINLHDIFLGKIFFIHCIDPFIYLICRFSFIHSDYLFCMLSLLTLLLMLTVNWMRMMSLCTIPTKHINYPINDLLQITDSYLLVYKVFISLGQNIDDICQVSGMQYKTIQFFMHFIISVIALSGMVYCVFYFAKASYALNVVMHLRLRIFGLTIIVLLNGFLICFYRPNVNKVLYYVCLVSVVLMAIYLSSIFDPIAIGMNNINGDAPHLQILFITNILESGKAKLYFEIYNERIKKHYLFCGRCLLCRGIDEEVKMEMVTSFETFQQIFLGILIKKQKMERSENTAYNFLFDFLILLSEINSHLELNYTLHLKFRKLLFKYRNFNGYIYYNLRYIYEKLCDNIKQQENIEQKHFITFYNINSKLQIALDKLLEFIIHPHTIITPKDIVDLSNHFFDIAHKQHKQLNERDKMQYYPLVLMRIVHEELLNLPISKFEGTLRESENYNEDFLNQHFNEDKTMIISLNTNKKLFLIERVGHNLHWYLKKELTDMFPKDFKQYALQRFNDAIEDNEHKQKLFTFIVNISNTNNVIYETFSYSFYISPALKEDNFLIFGEYILGSRGLLITEQFNPNEEFVYWISDELSQDLSLITYLTKKNIYQNEEPKTPNRTNIFNFMNKISQRKLSFSGQKNYTFKLFIEFATSTSQYKIFFVKPKRKFKESIFPFLPQTSQHNNNTSSDEENSDTDIDMNFTTNFNLREQYTHYKKKSSWVVDDTSSVMTTSTDNSIQHKVTTSHPFIYGSHRTRPPIIVYNKRFMYTKNLMLVSSLIMIVFNVVSLYIELCQNATVRELSSIYTNLRAANRLYYTLIAVIFSITCIGDQYGKECRAFYKEHSLEEIVNRDVKVNLYEYIVNESKVTIEDFRERVKMLKKNVHSLKDDTITMEFEQCFMYKKLSIKNNDVNVIAQNTTFANGLDLLINSMYAIVNEKGFEDQPIYFFSTYPKYDFSYMQNTNVMTSTQMEYYNCFLNYMSYLRTWNNIQLVMSEIIQKHLKKFYRISMIFMICSFLFHLVLGALLFFYLYSFLCIFMINVEKIMVRMKKEKNIVYFKKKFTILKSFCNLYEINPLTLIKNLDDMDWQIQMSKTQKIKQTQSKVFNINSSNITTDTNKHFLSFSKEDNNNNNFLFSWMSYYKLLSSFFKYVVYIIIYYVLIFFLFSLLCENQMTNTKLIFHSIESISFAESNGFNGLSLSLMMIITNQTTYIANTHSKTSYMNETLEASLFRSVKNFYDFERGNKKLIKSINDYFELNCDNFYLKMNDSKIYQVSKLYEKDELINGLIHDCKVNKYFDFNDEKIFVQNVYYNLIQFLNSLYQDISYEGYLKQMESKILMKVLNKVFIVFRPMRNWVNEVVYKEGIHRALNELTLILVLYLVINNLTEVLLLMLIYFFFIVEIQKINTKINLLLSVVSVKDEHKKNIGKS